MLLSEREARSLCEKLLRFVKADDASVSVSSSDTSHLRFAANSFATSGRRESFGANVTVWNGKKRGSASASDPDDASLKMAVEQAQELSSISPVDKEYLPTLGPQKYRPTHGYIEATANISVTHRAQAINDVITACEKADVIGAGFHQAIGTASASLTKNGNFHYHRSSLVSLSVTARTKDGGSSGYFVRNHFDVAKLDTARIAREAIQKALASRNPRTLEPGIYPVILETQAVADLLRNLAYSFDARSAEEGRSSFSTVGGKTKLGEKVFDERLSLYSDPWNTNLPGAFEHDDLPAEKMYLVRNGVVENLSYSRFWAKEKGKAPTPGPTNVIIESTNRPSTMEEMLAATSRGLLVTRFWYIRSVDPRTLLQTGLTRDGVWYIENGKIQYPVRNFRFTLDSVMQMLAPGNIELIGASERISTSEGEGTGAALMPPLKLKQFHFTSASEAV